MYIRVYKSLLSKLSIYIMVRSQTCDPNLLNIWEEKMTCNAEANGRIVINLTQTTTRTHILFNMMNSHFEYA